MDHALPVSVVGFQAPAPTLLQAPPEHVAHYSVDGQDRPDPLRDGFLLLGGILAPLPERVRLPHEDDEGLLLRDDEAALPS